MRCIPIDSCADCPHRSHGGGFGQVAYRPKCTKEARPLPYNVESHAGRQVAIQTDGIPQWCPLPKYK